MAMLEVEGLYARYGEVPVLEGVSLSVDAGECVVLLGANGSGKTTTLACVSGLHTPTRGRIVLDGSDVTRRRAHALAAVGLALVPEGRRIFPDHSVRENLELGAYRLLRRGDRKAFDEGLREVLALFPALAERLDLRAGLLSGGEQQMLAIARALIRRPGVLLLDEPSLGLAPLAVKAVWQLLGRLRQRGLAILVAEQAAWAALRASDRAVVLQRGRVALAGDATSLLADSRLVEAYLGSRRLHTSGGDA